MACSNLPVFVFSNPPSCKGFGHDFLSFKNAPVLNSLHKRCYFYSQSYSGNAKRNLRNPKFSNPPSCKGFGHDFLSFEHAPVLNSLHKRCYFYSQSYSGNAKRNLRNPRLRLSLITPICSSDFAPVTLLQ